MGTLWLLSLTSGTAANPDRRCTLPNRFTYQTADTMPATATLTSKFQISIPKLVREELHWEAGQEFAFLPKGAGVLMIPIPKDKDLIGIAKEADTSGFRDRNDRY